MVALHTDGSESETGEPVIVDPHHHGVRRRLEQLLPAVDGGHFAILVRRGGMGAKVAGTHSLETGSLQGRQHVDVTHPLAVVVHRDATFSLTRNLVHPGQGTPYLAGAPGHWAICWPKPITHRPMMATQRALRVAPKSSWPAGTVNYDFVKLRVHA